MEGSTAILMISLEVPSMRRRAMGKFHGVKSDSPLESCSEPASDPNLNLCVSFTRFFGFGKSGFPSQPGINLGNIDVAGQFPHELNWSSLF